MEEEMKMKVNVKSSMIKSVKYSSKKHELKITFLNDVTYKYDNVQGDVFNSFMNSESKGQFFCEAIKGCYTAEKI